MRNRRRISAIIIAATITWPGSLALAAVQIPCSKSVISIDDTFISLGPRVCFQWMDLSPGSALFSEELVAKSGNEYLSFVVDRAGAGTDIRPSTSRVRDWLPGAYDWVGRGATDWGEERQVESDLGSVQYASFLAGDSSACLGFRLYRGHVDDWARMRITGAYCNLERDWVGATDVQHIFDMVNIEKGEGNIHKYFIK
jgi:hypothetical protein